MSRSARKYKYASFFHVIVQGIEKEDIFKKKRYINEYLKLIRKYTKELNLDIIAYCVMTNHAHLLIRANKVENLSKLMQKVNSLYAKYYNYMENGRVGYVFRDRFVSEPIDSKTYLINCIKYIHMNPVKAQMVKRCGDYEFSSYNSYVHNYKFKEHNSINEIIDTEEILSICTNESINQNFFDIDKIDVKDKFFYGINKYVNKEQIKLWQIFNSRDSLIGLVKYLKNIEGIKYVQIRENLMLSKGIMESILRSIRMK